MAKKKLSELELKLKKLGILAKSYTDAKAAAEKVYLIEKATANTGYLKTYILAAGVSTEGAVTQDNKIGEIDIPKDFLVKSGEVKTVDTADTPYTGAVIGDKYIDLVLNTKGNAEAETDSHIYIPVKDLVDIYTGGNGITITNNVVAIDLDAAGGLQLTGSTDGQKKVAIKLNASASGLGVDGNGLKVVIGTNANGLSVGASGLELALATASANGAMSAADKAKLDNLYALLSDAELASWFGYASTSTMVTTTLPAVSDDSITDEA